MENNLKIGYTSKDSLHFIGLGGAGANILRDIHNIGMKASYTYIDNKPHDMPEDVQFVIFDKKYVPVSLNSFAYIDAKNIVLLTGLGGNTGTFLSIHIYKKLHTVFNSVYLFATTPFAHEGTDKNKFASFTVQLFDNENVFIVSNENYRIEFGQ